MSKLGLVCSNNCVDDIGLFALDSAVRYPELFALAHDNGVEDDLFSLTTDAFKLGNKSGIRSILEVFLKHRIITVEVADKLQDEFAKGNVF